MSEFIYLSYYSFRLKMGKPDGLFRHSGEEKYRIDAYFFNERKLMDLENDNIREKQSTEDVELEYINVAT